MNLSPGTIIGDKYRLIRRLAVGGQGAVWVAVHVQLQSEVAVKFLDLSQSNAETARMRFEREARAAARIRHQHIVPVIDVGEHENTPYLVMELCEGENLDKRLKSVKHLDTDTTAHLLNQIARGLRRMHEAGFVHRDLKPSNIFLAKTDEGEIIKILDFGIVKETNPLISDGTKTGEFMGSVYYVSPEQIKDAKTADFRSDLWSLGVILYRALTGKLPFPGPAIGTALHQILAGSIEPPTQIEPELPSALDTFFKKALNRNRNERFQSAIEMAEAFARACNARKPQPSMAIPEGSEFPSIEVSVESEISPTPSAPPPETPPTPPLEQRRSNPIMPATPSKASSGTPGHASPLGNLMSTLPLQASHLMNAGFHPRGGTQKLPNSAQALAEHHPSQNSAKPDRDMPAPSSIPFLESAPPPSSLGAQYSGDNAMNISPHSMITKPPSDETITAIAHKNPFSRLPSNTRWVVGGLILGTLFGGLIALVVILIRT